MDVSSVSVADPLVWGKLAEIVLLNIVVMPVRPESSEIQVTVMEPDAKDLEKIEQKLEEIKDLDGNPTGAYGRRVGFEDVVWTTPGDPVSKPAGQDCTQSRKRGGPER